MKISLILEIFGVVCLAAIVRSTLSASDRNKSKNGKYRLKNGPRGGNVTARGLVSPEPLAKDIIVEHGTFFEGKEQRTFDGAVLGYVTPWNNRGYDVAKLFSSKFSHVSPVWLQIKRKKESEYEITGRHDVDLPWIEELRRKNKKIKILPRILFEGWRADDYYYLFSNLEERLALCRSLVDFCKEFKLDGTVLEFWSQIGGSIRKDILVDFVDLMGKQLRYSGLDIILVVPPVRNKENIIFTRQDFEKLHNSVSFFSLMTYDYSNPQKPGPNAPVEWIKMCIETLVPDFDEKKRSKILMGLNFYGNDYTIAGGGPILGQDFVKLLQDYKGRLKLDEKSKENFFEVRSKNEKHLVFYPTLYSVSERIKLAKSLGTGLSIWEIGQGLDYFYDLI